MKAIVAHKYGSPQVLEFEDVEKPTPKDDEVLVRIHAASLNAYDWRLIRGKPFFVRFVFGFFKPKHKIPGADVSGMIEDVGKNVKGLKKGDEVYGDISECGNGAFAEYTCVRENALALKPTNLNYEEAAAVPFAAITALQGLRDYGQVQAGQKVAINGASGGVGSFAVQIAKSYGAEVTAVCSAANAALMQSLGADHVIDYAQEDFTKSGKLYDLIFAVNGYHPIADYKHALSANGNYIMAGGSNAQMFQAMTLGPSKSKTGGKKMGGFTMKPKNEDLVFMRELIESGKVMPAIDRRYPLSDTAAAISYLEKGHAKGKVVIFVDNSND
jgi:NADPH:quinone reductase-like Zn-dependent oxidoreductase